MIKDKKKIKKKYKLFNFTKQNNLDRKYVDGINKPWWKRPKDERDPKTKKIIRSKHQLDEKSFYEVLKIFFPQHNIIKQEKISNTELFSVIPDFRIELPNATSYNPETEKEDNINGIIFSNGSVEFTRSIFNTNTPQYPQLVLENKLASDSWDKYIDNLRKIIKG